jgi:RNA polymerase sigma factor (sigma-70 family)
MRLDNVLKQEEFDGLLGLFSENREEAGVIYEELRKSLVRYFESRDCRDADMLADETLFRVASKAHTFDPTRHTRPSSFVFGFASKILLEYSRDPNKLRITYDRWVQSNLSEPVEDVDSEEEAAGMECLRKCLGEMAVEDRELMIAYYGKEKQEKIASRKILAERLGIKMETLHMRVHRLRGSLKKCMKRCQKSELP